MVEKVIYLDTSAIVKRYVREPGSEYVRSLYRDTYSGDLKLAFSAWNIGETLGVLDKAWRTGRLDEAGYKLARARFLAETFRLAKLGALLIVQVKTRVLKEAWGILERHHIYQADALQIASAKAVNAELIVLSDRKLDEVARKEGITPVYLGS